MLRIDTENGPVGPWVEETQHDGTVEYVRYQGTFQVIRVHPSWELNEPSMDRFMIDRGDDRDPIFEGLDYFDAEAAWENRDLWKTWTVRYDDTSPYREVIYADTKEEALQIADGLVERMLAGEYLGEVSYLITTATPGDAQSSPVPFPGQEITGHEFPGFPGFSRWPGMGAVPDSGKVTSSSSPDPFPFLLNTLNVGPWKDNGES